MATISNVVPNTGLSVDGGERVDVYGSGFYNNGPPPLMIIVDGGGPNEMYLTDVTLDDTGHCHGTTAAIPAGTYDITVVSIPSPGDTDPVTLPDGITFGVSVIDPTITNCSPNNGPANAQTPVTLTGTGFLAGATVTFGGVPATSVVVVGPTSITCVTPVGIGTVNIVVTNTDTGSGTLVNGYRYNPVVTSATPNRGLATGDTSVTLAGAGFISGATVTFGGSAAHSVVVNSAISITCHTPAHAAGAVDVVVTNPDTGQGTLAGGFTYVAVATIRNSLDLGQGIRLVEIVETTPLANATSVGAGSMIKDGNGILYTKVQDTLTPAVDLHRVGHVVLAAIDPAVTNDIAHGCQVGWTWINTVSKASFTCVDATAGAAVWRVGSASRLQTIYVGKHGSDANDGLSPDRAKLTIAAAITAAGAPVSEAAAVAVVVVDDGTYNESPTLVSFVNLYAPTARITGRLTVADSTTTVIREISGSSVNAVRKSAGTGKAYVWATSLRSTNTSAIYISAGELEVIAQEIYSNWTGLEATGNSVITLKCHRYTALVQGMLVTSATAILDIGIFSSPGVQGINCSGTIYGRIGWMTAGSALDIQNTSFAHLSIEYINATTAYNVDGTSKLWLFCNRLVGARVCAATGVAVVSLATRDNYAATTDPGVGDDTADGYSIGSCWVNTTTRVLWMADDVTAGAAKWRQVTNLAHMTYLAGPVGAAPYQTVQAAVTAALAAGGDQIVYILPGTYNENVTITGDGIFLSLKGVVPHGDFVDYGTDAPLAKITGKLTIACAGVDVTVNLSDLYVAPAAGAALEHTGVGEKYVTLRRTIVVGVSGDLVTYAAGSGYAELYLLEHSRLVLPVTSSDALLRDHDGTVYLNSVDSSLTHATSGAVKTALALENADSYVEIFDSTVNGQIVVDAAVVLKLLSGSFYSGDPLESEIVLNAAAAAGSFLRARVIGDAPKVGGVQAATLPESPVGSAGDILQYSGTRWEVVAHPAAAGLSLAHIDMVAAVTAADGDLACATPLSETPVDALFVHVNGSGATVGDGVTTGCACYFSCDGGATARLRANISAGDDLYWNGSVAGFQLDASDRISYVYVAGGTPTPASSSSSAAP